MGSGQSVEIVVDFGRVGGVYVGKRSCAATVPDVKLYFDKSSRKSTFEKTPFCSSRTWTLPEDAQARLDDATVGIRGWAKSKTFRTPLTPWIVVHREQEFVYKACARAAGEASLRIYKSMLGFGAWYLEVRVRGTVDIDVQADYYTLSSLPLSALLPMRL
mmetsp:Transcript_6543/g.20428  ORF Transcript_6543/g.20428 Transcript_6543/m.20428 type:complete len:160 (+) Transcript_6543:191-670(+)|eukprot:CAMPEP_0198664316 /NCGR_PEP_ID=MMETSP1467-20131203/55750_1 /TAXON_ID=1462469 /ORGANISM="unid. sp., Strain CCMP2135" /LENGTH=159 /DNA_ID=CAMNT_0044400877 /DNA_START=171 /DNA_END=650 /DNA_ORIENTATION=+